MANEAALRLPFSPRRVSEIALPAFFVTMLLAIVIPLPPVVLDFLITASLALGILTVMMTMYLKEAIEFSTFPTIILVSTIYRLVLNISTTRAILTTMEPGNIIKSFGSFVLGGSVVVGLIIFIIIVFVNFVVITHGAKRIGEVAARFALDAMPGKQMSIDADLNHGLITDQEARTRRRKLEREADYFGAMDGASNFVQRDAIAGIVIALINIVGGFIIGMTQHGLSAAESFDLFTRLTVGDGLVAQIPALMISTATGIMVTNAASEEDNLSMDVLGQYAQRTDPLQITGGVLMVLALLGFWTKMPPIPLAFLGGTLLAMAYYRQRTEKEAQERAATLPAAEEPRPDVGKAQDVSQLLHVDPMELEIGYALIPLVDPEQKGDLLDRVTMIRRQTALEMGLVVPPIRIRDNIQLKPNDYSIKIRGNEVTGGNVMVERFLAMNPGEVGEEIDGVPTTEPAFGLPAIWITEDQKDAAEMAGYTIVDPASVVATHLTEVIRSHGYQLLGRQEVKSLLDTVKEKFPAVVEELVPDVLSVGEIQKVLQNLLRERVPIRNLVTILETLADYGGMTKDVDVLTEYVRAKLAREICHSHQMPDGTLPVITLDPEVEEIIQRSIHRGERASYAVLPPDITLRLKDSLQKELEKATTMNYHPLLLASPRVRTYLKKLVDPFFPSLVVLSHSEITPEIKLRSIGTVQLGTATAPEGVPPPGGEA